jgi:ADP-ribose pyrophosphatase
MKFQIMHRDTVFRGKIFDLQKVKVRMPDDHLAVLDLLIHPGAVVILPIDQKGNILFIRQLRVGAGGMLLELPAGTLEPEEDPADCAGRELREETGMAARELHKLGNFFLAPGYSTEYLHIYLATDLYPSPLPGDADEYLTVKPIPVKEAYAMAQRGEMDDGKTLAVLFMALPYLSHDRDSWQVLEQ